MDHYSAAWYRSVLDAMHDMVLVKGPASNLLWANKAFLIYYGMSEAELLQIVDADHSDPDDTLQYVKDDLTTFESGKSLDIPQEAVTDAAGDSRMFHTIKSPFFVDGSATGTVGMSRLYDDTMIVKRDIDHKDAKAFVAPLQSLSESFPNPMLMVDVRQRVISSSPLWKQYFGDPVIRPDSAFTDTHPELQELCAHLTDCLAQQSPMQTVIEHLGPDGVLRMFSARISPWKYKDGSIGGATIIATDVSVLYEQSAELQRANNELMQFSYRASHDLKGPLTTAKGLATFIVDDIAAGDLGDAADNAGKIVKLMEKLEKSVIDFLDLARADVLGTQDVAVDLDAVIGEICDGLAHQITDSGVVIETDLHIRHLRAQRTRISQILENLIANGIKYSDPEKEHKFVKVSAYNTAEGGYQLSVEDNGVGIPPEAKEKVFDLFSRFHASSEGTGLGLAIVKKHVEALSGSVTTEDTGDGTLFQVTFPRIIMELAS